MIWIIILAIICMVSMYVSFNLFRKIEELEVANEEYSNWISSFEIKIKGILTTIKNLDSKDMFEKDDEVGSVYEQISDVIKSLEEVIHEK